MGSSATRFDIMKFDGIGNFGLWQRRVKDLLVQQGMAEVLVEKKPDDMKDL